MVEDFDFMSSKVKQPCAIGHHYANDNCSLIYAWIYDAPQLANFNISKIQQKYDNQKGQYDSLSHTLRIHLDLLWP